MKLAEIYEILNDPRKALELVTQGVKHITAALSNPNLPFRQLLIHDGGRRVIVRAWMRIKLERLVPPKAPPSSKKSRVMGRTKIKSRASAS